MTNLMNMPVPRDLIGGSWMDHGHGADEEWQLVSPADLKDSLGALAANYSHVEAAVDAAEQAFKAWRNTGIGDRIQYLRRLQEVFQARSTEFAEVIARETGKPLWEAEQEAKALVSKIDISIEHSLGLVANVVVPNALPGVDGEIFYRPRGVFAVVGPFNFPGHLPNGHIIPAILTGNTVVFKPSEKTPFTAQLMAECYVQAGLPKGVFNLIHGRAETGKRLITHPHVSGILFTGSYDVGLKIKEATLTQHKKLLALEMGGKNATIIWEDCNFKKAVQETLIGAFLTTGQRCSCTSRILVHDRIYDRFLKEFYEASKRLEVDHWANKPFMGPLIDAEALEKYLRFQEIAYRESEECIMRGKRLERNHAGYYVSPSIYTIAKSNPQSTYQKTEIFGPNVAIYRVSDLDQTIEINNALGFGLVTSVFTEQQSIYEKCLLECEVGLVNWNRTTNGASSRLPFGGIGKSGNDRPSGHFAVLYTTVPVATLKDHLPWQKSSFPGLNYNGDEV